MQANEQDESEFPRKQYAIETRSAHTDWEWGRWQDWVEESDLDHLISVIDKNDPCTGEVEYRIVEREVHPKKVYEGYTWNPPRG